VTAAAASIIDRGAAAEGGARPISLMIVDDSAVARAVLSRMLSACGDFEIVALAGNAEEAIDSLKSVEVDIVLLDVEMPGTSGLQALPQILRYGNGARVLVVSSNCEEGAEATVQALALGAADTLPKPGAGSFSGRFSEVLAERIRRIGRVDRTLSGRVDVPSAPLKLRAMSGEKLACLALGASTGGLHALSAVLKGIPRNIGAPILITQHLPAVFMPFFAKQMASASGRNAVVAEEGLVLRPEEIVVATGDAHLCLERDGSRIRVKLDRSPASSGCLPSVDPMLWSVSEIYGKAALAVILSGMGRDGLVGSARIVDRGGAVLVQNQATSAVWGMPRAVADAGLASAVLSPAEIGARVAAKVEASAWR
jgi:two-component system chemotaxis response regulator CheB